MSYRYKLRQAFLIILALCVAEANAQDVAANLATYLDSCVNVKQFNGSVMICKNGKTILKRGFGMANFEHDVPNTPDTKFRIGSITKQFTSMAIMLLHEQGKLNVDNPISKYLHDAPETWANITIHHLLTHTSGIPSYTSMEEYGRDMMLSQTHEQMIARFKDKPLNFIPGKKFKYCNSGYFLLGLIIECASGQTYEDFLQTTIFEPLGLHDTGYDRFKSVIKRRATGYSRRDGQIVHADYLDMSQPYAAGSLYSTVEDLQRWDQALNRKALLSREGYQTMYTPDQDSYAYGWSVGEKNGRQTIRHGGGINGFVSYILRFPNEQLCVTVLCNAPPANPGGMAYNLAAIVLGEDYELPQKRKTVEVDSEELHSR